MSENKTTEKAWETEAEALETEAEVWFKKTAETGGEETYKELMENLCSFTSQEIRWMRIIFKEMVLVHRYAKLQDWELLLTSCECVKQIKKTD